MLDLQGLLGQARKQALYQGLLGAGIGLLGQRPSPVPISLGQSLGAGLAGFQQGSNYGYDSTLQRGVDLNRMGLLQDEMDLRQKDYQRRLDADQRAAGMLQGLLGDATPTSPTGGVLGPASVPAPQTAGMGYPALAMAESGGRNIGTQVTKDDGTPGSDAFGPYQFTSTRWNDLIARHPELGMTAADRSSPAAQEKMMPVHRADDAAALRKSLGRDPTEYDLNIAHRLGAGGAAALLTAQSTTTADGVLNGIDPAILKSNPQWRGKTVQDLVHQLSLEPAPGADAPQKAMQAATAGLPDSARQDLQGWLQAQPWRRQTFAMMALSGNDLQEGMQKAVQWAAEQMAQEGRQETWGGWQWNPQLSKWQQQSNRGQYRTETPTETFGPRSLDPMTGKVAQTSSTGKTTYEAPQLPGSLEERDRQIIMQGDPASPEYAMAYANLFQNPKWVAGTDEQGRPTIVPIMPAIPQGVRPPTYGQAAQAAPAPAPMGSAASAAGDGGQGAEAAVSMPSAPTSAPVAPGPQPGGGPSVGQPIVTGVGKGQTEDVRKTQELHQMASADLQTAMQDYDALGSTWAQLKAKLPFGNVLQSEPYQRAENAARSIISSYLYSVSGAQITEAELQRQLQMVMPALGDSVGTKADKRARMQRMVEALAARGGIKMDGTAGAAKDDPLGIR